MNKEVSVLLWRTKIMSKSFFLLSDLVREDEAKENFVCKRNVIYCAGDTLAGVVERDLTPVLTE